MTTIRRLGAVTIAAPLAMGFSVLAAPAAHAAVSVSPADGAVVTSSGFTVKGSVGGTNQGKLTFNGLSYEGKGTISRSFDAHELKNGTYTVKIEKMLGFIPVESESSTFKLRTPPNRPSGVSADISGRKLKVTWNLGPEPDLTGYDVSASSLGSKSVGDASACSGTVCSATFSIPSNAVGRVTVSVRARRSSGSGGALSSGGSSTSATVPGSTSGGSGGTAPGGGSYPGGGSPLLPVTEDSPVSLPTVAPDGATPGFQYPTPVPEIAAQSPVTTPNAQKVAAVDNVQWGKSIASALILLIVAAHLGTWTRRTRLASAPLSGQGTTARLSRVGSGRARVRMTKASIAHAEAAAKAAALLEEAGRTGSGKDRPAKAGKARSGRSAKTRTKPTDRRGSAAGLKPASKPKSGARHKAKPAAAKAAPAKSPSEKVGS